MRAAEASRRLVLFFAFKRSAEMTSSTVCILATIFVYLVGMLVIGFHYAKKNESSTDFLSRRQKTRPSRHGNERRGERYVKLFAYGLAGPCVSVGCCRRRLDRHRTCRRYISQLAFNCRQTSQIYP